MKLPPGYKKIKDIYKSKRILIYKATCESTGKPCIVKIAFKEYPPPDIINRFNKEFMIVEMCDKQCIVPYLEFGKIEERPFIVMEDIGGITINEYYESKSISVREFLSVAIKISKTLEKLHRSNIIHKDINPNNILIVPETGDIRIIDYEIASQLSKEIIQATIPENLEGTLLYMAPEQTGRINRSVDFRSDFYALGITFYKLLCRKVPFESNDLMELVHAHIAIEPKPIIKINKNVPEVLSRIVHKLIEKSADDRYQSIKALIKDLEFVVENLHSSEALASFKIAEHDVSSVLQIPEKLYGRATELNELFSNLNEAKQGMNVLQIITGNAGVGKSELLNELQKVVIKQKGLVAKATCDKTLQEIPFSPLISIFNSLIKQLLAEPEQTVNRNKKILQQKLNNNGNVLAALIPEIEIFIGKQTPVEALGALESQNRLIDAFVNLIDFFSQIATPVVFVFDDMQWADKSTLQLLKSIIINDTYKYLFLIGAFRNNEIEASHQLNLIIAEAKQKALLIKKLNLKNLTQPHVLDILINTLKLTENELNPLAQVVFQKTAGNPFFVKEFIKQMVSEKLLVFNKESGNWSWDIEKISYSNITDNVAELLEEKLLYLPRSILSILKDAASIGHIFDLNTLSHISKKRRSVLNKGLQQVINYGFIVPLSPNYNQFNKALSNEIVDITFQFQHGRMLNAVYSLLSEKESQKKHLAVAEFIYNGSNYYSDEKLIEIVNHYNKALNLLSKKEKDKVCELNFKVGRNIKETLAYSMAINYFKIAKSLLPENYWNTKNTFSSTLNIEIGECEYLLGNAKKAEDIFSETFMHTNEKVQKLRVAKSQITQFIHQANFSKAIDIAISSLTTTNVHIPSSEEEIKTEITENLNQLNDFLDKNSLNSLLDNVSTNEMQLLTTNILSSILESSFMVSKVNLTILAALKIIKYCIKNGVNKNAALGFAYFGTFYNTMYSNLEKGFVFGNFAVQLGQQVKNPKSFHKVLVLHGFMCSYIKEPLQYSLNMLGKAYIEAHKNGDYTFANYALSDELIVSHLMGNKISASQILIEKYEPFVKKVGVSIVIELISIYKAVFKAYKNKTDNINLLIEAILTKYEKTTSYLKSVNYQAGLGLVQIIVTEFLIINKSYKQALKIIQQNTNAQQYLKGFANEIAYYFYYSLAICKNYNEFDAKIKQEHREILNTNLFEIKKYADANPTNFMHFYNLVRAEVLQIENKKWEAVENYELAIKNAQDANNLKIKALANEFMADFYLSNGNNKVFKTYIETAFYNYNQWENYSKIRQLESTNPIINKNDKEHTFHDNDTKYSNVSISRSNDRYRNFDLTTALKFAQNISQEVNLSKLLTKTMSIIIENAGASSGSLLLCNNGKFYIEAEAHANKKSVTVLQNIDINHLESDKAINNHLSLDIVNYVIRTHENIILNNAIVDSRFQRSQYLQKNKVKSVLCLPIIKQGNLSSILYLENRLAENVFTLEHLQLLKHLSSQISISVDNARLYDNLEHKIALRTKEVVKQKTEIEAAYNEQQKQKNELQKFAKQLEVANQTKDKFFSIIAHDLRSPFGALLNLTDLLYHRYDSYDEERRKHFIKKLNETSEHTFELLQNLLTWSMSQNNTIDFEPQYYSINELIDKAMDVVKQLAQEKHIELISDIKFEEVAYVDKNMILTVIRNLLSNAIKFTPENGKIILNCDKTNENRIKVSIIDSGIGMSAKQIDELFELNKSTTTLGTNNEKGTGLGLILCKDFIERNGGKLFVESQLKKGSTFSFSLPIQ